MEINKEKLLKLRKMFWPIVVLSVYICLNVVLILHHENWRDEAQAWQIARKLSLPDIFRQLKYEGHPCLWYLILFPFAKLSFPFGYMGFISLFFTAIAVYLLLKKAPFCIPVKLVLIFSSCFVYYLPVISRSYCLIPPILAWLAVLYPQRREKPLWYGLALALLIQTQIMMIGLAFFLSFFWLLEVVLEWRKERQKYGRKYFIQNMEGIGLSLGSALFLIWQLIGSIETNAAVDAQIASTLHSNLHRINVGSHWAVTELIGMWFDDSAWKTLRLIIVLGMVALLLFYAWKEAVIYIGTTVVHFLVFTYVNLASPQKAQILMLDLVFILWIIMQEKREFRIRKWCCQLVLVMIALISIKGHGPRILSEIDQAYSSSKEMADYIREHVPEDIPLITTGDVYAEGTAAYLPERIIWYPVTEEAVTFLVWNEKRTEIISYEEMIGRVKKQYPNAEEIYLLCGEGGNVHDWEAYCPIMQEVLRIDAYAPNESAILYYTKIE